MCVLCFRLATPKVLPSFLVVFFILPYRPKLFFFILLAKENKQLGSYIVDIQDTQTSKQIFVGYTKNLNEN